VENTLSVAVRSSGTETSIVPPVRNGMLNVPRLLMFSTLDPVSVEEVGVSNLPNCALPRKIASKRASS